MSYSDSGAFLCGHVEEDGVLAGDDVGDAVAVVGHWSEPSSGGNDVRVRARVEVVASNRGLRRGKPPRFA